MKSASIVAVLLTAPVFSACGGGSGSGSPPEPQPPPTPTISVDVGVKQLIFSWPVVADMRWQAAYYKLLENPDGHSGFTQVGEDIPAEMGSVRRDIAVHLFDFANALYILEACNNYLCSSSTEINVMNGMLDAVGYFKSSNTDDTDGFGGTVALSGDGRVMAVGARYEDSSATSINGDQDDNSLGSTGAVYLFRLQGTNWSQEAYIKASNTRSGDNFGVAVALSSDGNTMAVGASSEDSAATGINGDQDDNSAPGSGAVYLFRFDGAGWFQQAYIKASNSDRSDHFGSAIALNADGDTLVVGASSERSDATGINGDESVNLENPEDEHFGPQFGAAYLFRFDGNYWFQQAYIKASNTGMEDNFGRGVALSADGNTLAVGAPGEDSSATSINGDQDDNSAESAGAVYLYRFDGTDWFQQSYIKASNAGEDFSIVALSADGNTLAVGASGESSAATGINGDQDDNSAPGSGAVYLFRFDSVNWFQQAYIKASNSGSKDSFGSRVSLSANGNRLAVPARGEDSAATGVDGDQSDNSAEDAGAVYLFRFNGADWFQQSYVKASNTDIGDWFGAWGMSLSADGNTLAVGAHYEDSSAAGINGDQDDDSAFNAGAVYVY